MVGPDYYGSPYYIDPAQHLRTAGEDLDDLDHDISGLSDIISH